MACLVPRKPGPLSLPSAPHPAHIDISLDSNYLLNHNLRGPGLPVPSPPLQSPVSSPLSASLNLIHRLPQPRPPASPSLFLKSHFCPLAPVFGALAHYALTRLLMAGFNLFFKLLHVVLSRHGLHILRLLFFFNSTKFLRTGICEVSKLKYAILNKKQWYDIMAMK